MPKKPHPIAVARIERGVSQQQLAALCGIANNTISNMENHKRPYVYVSELYRIAKALGMKHWWVLASDENLQAKPRTKPPLTVAQLRSMQIHRMRKAAGLPPDDGQGPAPEDDDEEQE